MQPRLNAPKVAPKMYQAMVELEGKVRDSGLEASLIELVKTRASQINGCAFCIAMHTRDAITDGEDPMRLYLLDAWHEAPCYTDRERAALAWTDALTLVAATHAPDADYEALKAQFSDEDQVKLTMLICTINAWNRIAIGFRAVPQIEASDGQGR
ncbi:carboxymuconolactone decarboxylase family protein [Bradyrhizobium sp. WD16]|uniref:carboxymuconolactone decarboxylase family protein n=1 Tax=Bradyrhizobium sp. WD16 TaxID=1521768 RepID=UPI0020A3FAF0|nr:carboxymuconolactone decarboxylase family protein [Bradyrhizobium sp. WD16]UTD29386.1 alkylhydroperoxidase [Bradyrhizobium sp. WD16]